MYLCIHSYAGVFIYVYVCVDTFVIYYQYSSLQLSDGFIGIHFVILHHLKNGRARNNVCHELSVKIIQFRALEGP